MSTSESSKKKSYEVIQSFTYGNTSYVMGFAQFPEFKKVVACQKGGRMYIHDSNDFNNKSEEQVGGVRRIVKWDEKSFFILGKPVGRFLIPSRGVGTRVDFTVLVFEFKADDPDSLHLQHSYQGKLFDIHNTLRFGENTFISACKTSLQMVDCNSKTILKKMDVKGVNEYTNLILSKMHKNRFYVNFDNEDDGKPIVLYEYENNNFEMKNRFIHEDNVYTNTFSTFMNNSGHEILVAVSDAPSFVYLYNTTYTKDKHLIKKFSSQQAYVFYSDIVINHPNEFIIAYGDIGGKCCIYKFLNVDEGQPQSPEIIPMVITEKLHTSTVSMIEVFYPFDGSPKTENLRIITCSRDSKIKVTEFEDLKYYGPRGALSSAERRMIMEDLKERIEFVFKQGGRTLNICFRDKNLVQMKSFESIPKTFLLL